MRSLRAAASIPNPKRAWTSVIERIAVEVEALEATLPAGGRVEAVGIGAPGPVDHVSGDLLTLVNLPGISNSPFRRVLQERLSLPVALDHDAKVAALGEFHYGAGRERESMIYIVIGTGVGAAIIYQGELIYGESNSAGESGHMTVDPNGHQCHCGSRGCLETYASGPALAKHYAAAAGETSRAPMSLNGRWRATRSREMCWRRRGLRLGHRHRLIGDDAEYRAIRHRRQRGAGGRSAAGRRRASRSRIILSKRCRRA